MLLFYIRKIKKTSKQKAKARLSPELEKKRKDLLFACFEIMLSGKHGGKSQGGKNDTKMLQYLSVDDLLIIDYDEDRK